jgi:hypothetical protein
VEVFVSIFNDFVSKHLGAIGIVMLVGAIVVLLLILMLFVQSRRIALLSSRLDGLTQGADGQSLEGVLDTHLETVVRVAAEVDELTARTAILEAGARMHFGRLGLVRFNPFKDRDNTGGDQSFALAMLDANNDGFVFSSLHARTGTRIYAKAIFGGESEVLMGAEEAQAVEIAASQGGGAPAVGSARSSGRGATAKPAGRKAAGSAKTARPTKASPGNAVGPAPVEESEDFEPVEPEPEPAEAGAPSPTA